MPQWVKKKILEESMGEKGVAGRSKCSNSRTTLFLSRIMWRQVGSNFRHGLVEIRLAVPSRKRAPFQTALFSCRMFSRMLLETVLGQHYRWKAVGATDIYTSQAVRTYAEWARTILQWTTSDGIIACPEAHLKVTLPKDGSSTPLLT